MTSIQNIQTIIFTAIPRGVTWNTSNSNNDEIKSLPVSVFVSPRLSGGTTLKDYPDWLMWIQTVRNMAC